MLHIFQNDTSNAIPCGIFKQEGLTLAALQFQFRKAAYLTRLPAKFSQEEMVDIDFHLSKAAAKIGYDYDIKRVFTLRQKSKDLTTVIMLQSRNFGYDFALVKVDSHAHQYLFEALAVKIFISVVDDGYYVPLETVPGLMAALNAIDRRYCVAAHSHLPQ